VTEARIVKNPRTGESRGFGFLIMDSDDSVDRAIRHLDGREWNGRRLLVERAKNVK
jgi:transformer-2 protein